MLCLNVSVALLDKVGAVTLTGFFQYMKQAVSVYYTLATKYLGKLALLSCDKECSSERSW